MPKNYLDKLYHELMHQSCVRSLVEVTLEVIIVRRLKKVMHKIYMCRLKKIFYKKLVGKSYA